MSTQTKPVGRWDAPKGPNFNTTDAIRHQGHGGMTPVEGCKPHSWFKMWGADRYRCCHCGVITTFEPPYYEP